MDPKERSRIIICLDQTTGPHVETVRLGLVLQEALHVVWWAETRAPVSTTAHLLRLADDLLGLDRDAGLLPLQENADALELWTQLISHPGFDAHPATVVLLNRVSLSDEEAADALPVFLPGGFCRGRMDGVWRPSVAARAHLARHRPPGYRREPVSSPWLSWIGGTGRAASFRPIVAIGPRAPVQIECPTCGYIGVISREFGSTYVLGVLIDKLGPGC